MEEQGDSNKSDSTVRRVRSFKAESETQTPVAMRVPSVKKTQALNAEAMAGRLVTAEQTQNAAIARRRRIMSKNKAAQNIRTREKTPEPGRTPVSPQPHEDTTTTDEEEPKSPTKTQSEIEADDTYAELRRKLMEKQALEKDDDDIDLDAIREAQVEEAKERRRRSISPFALPSKEDLANLQRKGSFIDPGNNLLSTVVNYPLMAKDQKDFDGRRSSLIALEDEDVARKASPSPTPVKKPISQPAPPGQKYAVQSAPVERAAERPRDAQTTNNTTTTTTTIPQQPTKKINPAQKTPKPCLKPPTNPSETNITPQEPQAGEAPPIRPRRSKSGNRSQGRTSESEMSEDQSRVKIQPEPQKAPKPKERRRTIATVKTVTSQESQKSPIVKRSKSATRNELDTGGIEITKTSSEIIELLQKAKNRDVSMPDEDERISNAVKAYVDRSRQLMTPTKLPSSPRRGSRATGPKTIEPLSDKEVMETFQQVQRRSIEMERSRRSSGYIDASQSELTSSCYSSSYSEDESDFDLSKKTMELSKKLALLKGEKDPTGTKPKSAPAPKKPEDRPKVTIAVDKLAIKRMLKNIRPVWREFRAEQITEAGRIKRLWNRCMSDLVILIIFCGMGGVMFRYTEGAFENFYKCGVKRVKRDFIDTLWTGSHNLREDDWKSMARNKLWEFETQLHNAHEAGVHSYSGQKAWSFMNSMVYCLTVVTTIGYGHIAPSTTTGRALTIVYAIIGIPLFLILLADFGKMFTRGIKFLWAFVRRLYYTGSCRKVRRTAPVQEMMKGLNMMYTAASTLRRPSQFAIDAIDEEQPPDLPPKPKNLSPLSNPNLLTVPSERPGEKQHDVLESDDQDNEAPQTPAPSVFEIDDEFNLPISVAITVLVIYILFGASIYVFWEEWGFFESFYFVFVSMSTIGFGDFVPNHPMYMMGSIVYLVFGLALTSMCINVVQVKLSDTFRQASAKIGATIGLKVSEEDGSLAPITPPPIEIPPVHGTSNGGESDSK